MRRVLAMALGLACCIALAGGVQGQQEQEKAKAREQGKAKGQFPGQGPIDFRELFLQLDANNDTVIDLEEVPDAAKPAFKRLLELGDTDKNGRLELPEMRALGLRMREGGLFGANLAERFKQLDKDGDGKLSRDEFQGPPARFDQLDENKDGLLTLEEAQKGPGPGNAGGPFAQILARLQMFDENGDGKISRDEFKGNPDVFNRLDTNNDGVITKEDNPAGNAGQPKAKAKAKARAKARKKAEPEPAAEGGFGPRMKQMDKDGNGKISKEEFEGPPALFERFDADKDGSISQDEFARIARAMAGRRFQQLDKNDDGKVSKDEFPGPAAVFDRLDADNDGALSPQEAAKFQGPPGAARKKDA